MVSRLTQSVPANPMQRPRTAQERAELFEHARKARAARVALARRDINEFCRFVIKDETSTHIEQAPVHEKMQALADEHKRLALITCPELGKCSPAGTMVTTPDGGLRAIEDFVAGGEVLLFDPETLTYRAARAQGSNNGVRPTIRVRTWSGREHVSTLNHPLYAQRDQLHGWVQAGDLRVGDQVMVPRLGHSDDGYMWDDIVAVEDAGEQETWALEVFDHAHCYIANGIVSHNTIQLGVARVLFKLGHNPDGRYVIVSENVPAAVTTIKVIKGYIESSRELHEVFPNLLPGKKWTETAITVVRKSNSRDASVTAYAPGKNITGARVDGMVIDDLVTSKNTLTKHRRDQIFNYVMNTLVNRLTAEGWVIFLSNAWHPDDAVHRLGRNAAEYALGGGETSDRLWHVERFPVISKGVSVWESRWPMSRIRATKLELIAAGKERQWISQYLCVAREDTDARFTEAAINKGLDGGKDIRLVNEIEQLELPPNLDPQLPGMPPKCAYDAKARMRYVQAVLAHHAATKSPPPFIITVGVDLAVQRHSKADLTALVALCTLPSGHRIILDVKAGRFTWSQICNHILDFNDRFCPQIILVENVAAQDYVLQHIRDICDAPVIGYTTGRGKADPALGIESIAGLLEGGWIILPGCPSGTLEGLREGTEMRHLCNDMLFYSPASHVGDRLMALWFANTAVTMLKRRTTQLSAICIGGGISTADKARVRAIARAAELAAEQARHGLATPAAETPRQKTALPPPKTVATPGIASASRRRRLDGGKVLEQTVQQAPPADKPHNKLPYWWPSGME